jgi:Flp pilus assembly protein TadB
MLSQDDRRQLAQLERQLRREDPEFVARMAGHAPPHRPPVAHALAAGLIWAVAVVLVAAGWSAAAIVVAVWAAAISGALMYRCRPARRTPPV